MPKTIMILRLTRSQQMALVDVLLEHLRDPNGSREFVDCSSNPATTTTVGELLALVGSVCEIEQT